jgi:3'-phosphoadenosine 5'-phosphosulfate sulfotransferase (PAPS reductase)/FAD synthetase
MTGKHVVGLSGGKDSTALALRLVETEPRDYEFICNETGNELPEMHAHWAKLEEMLGTAITKVRHSTDLVGLIDEMEMLPNFHARWCTRILKIEPTIEYFENLPEGSVLYVGLRADEEARRGLYGEDIAVRFPMREWGWNEAAVWKYLDERGVCIPKRTDCALCPYQRLGEWFALWRDHPEKYAQGVEIEKKFGHTFRSPQRDTWPADLESLGKEFASGRPIRKFKRDTTCRVCSL